MKLDITVSRYPSTPIYVSINSQNRINKDEDEVGFYGSWTENMDEMKGWIFSELASCKLVNYTSFNFGNISKLVDYIVNIIYSVQIGTIDISSVKGYELNEMFDSLENYMDRHQLTKDDCMSLLCYIDGKEAQND